VYEKSEIYLIKFLNGSIDTVNKAFQQPAQVQPQSNPNIEAPKITEPVKQNPVSEPENNRPTIVFQTEPVVPVNPNQLRFYRGWLMKGDSEITFSRFVFLTDSMAKKKKINELELFSKKAKANHRYQKTFAFVGIPTALSGVAVLCVAAYQYSVSGATRDVSGLMFITGALTTVAIGFEITSFINGLKKKEYMNKAMDLYNRNL
jgi:hypothetical protein